MADGPQDWGAQPAEAEGPAAWGAQPEQPTGAANDVFAPPQPGESFGKYVYSGVSKFAQSYPQHLLKGLTDYFETPGKAYQQGVTPEEETSFGINTALGEVGGETPFKVPPEITRITIPLAKEFQDGVIAPAAQRLDSFARTGDPNGVRLEQPAAGTVPAPIRPIEGSPFAGVPRSVAAKTGIPEVDSVLASPVTRAVIDNPVIDRSHDVPYMAGGSTPLNDPTVYIDRHVPKEQTVGGVTFDPAEPWAVHENVEQHTMEILTRGGMTDEEAYRVAHFQFAEPAEQAWYRAHGIDQVAAEKEQASWLPRIQHEPADNPPPNLYDKPYPHANVRGAEHEAVAETPPTPDEIQRGMDIIRNAPELQPKSAVPMLAEARELGVIGEQPDKSLNELPPREAGQRAMAANRAPDDKITGEPEGQQTAWRARWEQSLDKMGVAGDARKVISSIVEANDEFMPARQGDMRPGQVEQLASVTGLDSTKIDVTGTSSKIKTDAEMRNTTEAFRIVNDKIKQAAQALADKRGIDDEKEAGEMTRLELQRDLLLEATTSSKELIALRAEFGRAGNRLQELYKAMAETNGLKQYLKDSEGRTIDDVRDRARMIADTPPDALPKVLQSLRAPTKPGWAFWMWQQGLISGLVTHTKYLAVNTGTTFLERSVSPLVSALIGKARGQNVSLGAPLWANVGMVRGLPDAFAAAGQAFASGLRVPLESEIELAARGEENPELHGAQTAYTQTGPEWGVWKKVFNETQLSKAAEVLGIPGKSANMIHTFYKVLNERASASSRAYEAAFAEGAKGDAFWQRYDYHLANPSDEALTGAVDDAYSGAFMAKLGKKTSEWARALSTNPVMKWMFPFQHIPWNIERMTMEYSPLAVFGPDMRAALLGHKGGPAQNLALAKVAVGSSIMSYFIDKALSGAATPDYPTDPKERARWRLLNMQPNSVQMGDQWVGMDRLGPPGNLAKLGANIGSIIRNYDGKDDDAITKAIWAAGMVAVNQVGDETGFQTLRNLVDALENPRQATRFVAWQAGSLMPFSSFISQNASIMDPDMRQATTLVDGLKYRIPGLRETEMPKRDPLYGEPVPNPGYRTVMRESPVNSDPVKAELDRLKYYPTAPERTIGHVKLSDEQYDRYEATAGPLVKQMLSSAIQSPRYASMTDGQRHAMVKGYIAYGRAKARAAMQMHDPELIQEGIAARQAAIAGR